MRRLFGGVRLSRVNTALLMAGMAPWDTAAGVIIAREAGARVVDLNGNAHSTEPKETIAVSPGLIDELFKILQVSTTESVNSHT